MKKIKSKRNLILVFLVFLIAITFINTKGTYAVSVLMTKTEIQNMVTSTAISYLNNKTYSDYGQTAMDLGKQENDKFKNTYLWRQFTKEPEMVNRCNYYHIDCSSFAAIVYMYSLGYDFSEYYDQMGNGQIYIKALGSSFSKVSINQIKENYITGYKYHGKGPSTSFYTNLATKQFPSIEKGIEYKSTGTNSMIVYHYQPDGKEDENKKNTIIKNVKSVLEPGDILVYRVKDIPKINGVYDITMAQNKGHAMIYVGNKIDKTSGLIHSSGYDFVPDNNLIRLGNDPYSVRYDEITTLDNRLFPKNTSTNETKKRESLAITILRPINRFYDSSTKKYKISTLNKNAEARNELEKLKVEQYVETDITKKYKNSFNLGTSKYEKIRKSLSKYNSVNQGDIIDYSLYLQNNTKISYCGGGGGTYYDKTTCEESGNYKWKTTAYENKPFLNLTIEGKIPEGTTFISCNKECTYNQTKQTVTWKIPSLTSYATRTYKVKVIGKNNIANEGIKIITKDNKVLQLGKQVTKVNPTLNELNANILVNKVIKFKKLVEERKIEYSSTDISKNNIKDLDSITDKIQINNSGFIKSIYYNTLGIDLNYLNLTNIKAALFNRQEEEGIKSNDYAKKTDEEVKILTDENYKNINKMLVKGMYGGQYLRGNDNKDRANYIRLNSKLFNNNKDVFEEHDLEVGDIIAEFLSKNDIIAGDLSLFIYLGMDKTETKPVFAKFTENEGVVLYDDSSIKKGFNLFKEIYAKDLFAVLRPSQLYGTTINLNYKGGAPFSDLNTLYVAYDTYKNLKVPSKDSLTITFNYNKEVQDAKSMKSESVFNGWYYNEKKVTNDSKLVTNENHTLEAKWIARTIKLPSSKVVGYELEGWYSDSTLKTKVGAPGDNYTPTKSSTLYAKWIPNTYEITLDSGETNNPGTTKIYYQYGTSKIINNTKCYYYEDKELTKCLKNAYKIELPIKPGSKFRGYYDEPNGMGTNYINSSGDIINNIYIKAGNKTLYAKYITNALTETEKIDIKQNNIYSNEKYNKVSNFIKKLNIENKENYKIEIHNETNQIIDKIYTGSKTKVFLNNEKLYEYDNIVFGDVNKTGTVTMADVMKIASYLLDKKTMPESYNQKAADIDKNGVVKMNDVMLMVEHIIE